MKLFLKNNKIFMYLSARFTLQKFKIIVRADPYRPFLGTKWPICPEQFFWHKPLLLLSSTCWPFLLCKIYKKLLQPTKLWGCPIFGPKMVHLPQAILLGKLLKSFSSNYQPLSLCKISKKSLQWIHSYQDVQFLGIQWPICPNENLFQKTC